jgi:hypothetical protein
MSGELDPYSRYFVAIINAASHLYVTTRRGVLWTDIPYARANPSASATIISTSSPADLTLYTEVLRKASLYSDLVVLIVPIELDGYDTSYSASGWIRGKSSSIAWNPPEQVTALLAGRSTLGEFYADATMEDVDRMTAAWISGPGSFERTYSDGSLETIAELNQRFSSLVRAARCVFLPRRIKFQFGSVSEDVLSIYEPPIVGDPFSPYLPLNTPVIHPSPQFIYRNVVLPYFPEVSLDRLALISSHETDAFVQFTSFLKSQLREIAKSDCERTIDDLMSELEHGAARLNVQARKLAGGRLLRGAQVAAFAIGVGAALSPAGNIVREFAGLVGSVSVIDLLKDMAARRKASLEVQASDFFLPLMLSKETEKG